LRKPGSLPHWLSERYCLYTTSKNHIYSAEIHHLQWPLQDAELEVETNTVAQAAEVDLPPIQPVLHFSRRLEVLIWPLHRVHV
jgi:hypothetical protein